MGRPATTSPGTFSSSASNAAFLAGSRREESGGGKRTSSVGYLCSAEAGNPGMKMTGLRAMRNLLLFWECSRDGVSLLPMCDFDDCLDPATHVEVADDLEK